MVYPIITKPLGVYANMLIREEYLKSVVYLVTEDHKPIATAFFIGVTIGEGTKYLGAIPYLVTARHVIESSRPYGKLLMCANSKNNIIEYMEVPQDKWLLSNTSDIAIYSFAEKSLMKEFRQFDCRLVHYGILINNISNKNNKSNLVGIGDDVFFIGLFSKHPGKDLVKPVVRFGNVSMMPDDMTIETSPNTFSNIKAYLVESRSWGGHSGSPVYIYYPPDREYGKFNQVVWQIGLLGLVSSHYQIDEDVKFIGDILGKGKVPQNTGMAVVILAKDISDLLMDEDLQKERELKLKEHIEELDREEAKSIRFDSNIEDMFTKEKFHAILDSASQPISQETESDSKKSET